MTRASGRSYDCPCGRCGRIVVVAPATIRDQYEFIIRGERWNTKTLAERVGCHVSTLAQRARLGRCLWGRKPPRSIHQPPSGELAARFNRLPTFVRTRVETF